MPTSIDGDSNIPNQNDMIIPHLPLHEYTIGWISALPVEYAAATELLDEEHESPPIQDNDPTLYALGRIGAHNVVIACLPAGEIGLANAAIAATHLVDRFPSVKIGLMVGIGGGVPSKTDIRLGDVVVSQPGNGNGGVVQYDMGKRLSDGTFQHTSHINAPPRLLLNALSQVQSNHLRGKVQYAGYLSKLEENVIFSREEAGIDRLFEANYNHSGGTTCAGCDQDHIIKRDPRSPRRLVQIHYGTIASANTLMKDAIQRDQTCHELGNILCFEMEAAGLMKSFPCLVVRGISDYADSHKNKDWQPYASATAAAFSKEIISVIPPRDLATLDSIKAPWVVPFVKNPRFTGRSAILDQLHSCFNDTSNHPYVAIHGLGGCGKSAVATEFAHRVRAQYDCAVFWVSAFDELRFEQSYRTIAKVLQIPQADDPEKDILDLVQQKLNQYSTGKWLMVVDNVDKNILWDQDPKRTRRLWDYLPQNRNGMILFTSRSRKIAADLAPNDYYPLDEMKVNEAEELLRKSLPPTLYSDEVVSKFLKSLTYLPLAIIQALAFMKSNNTSLKRYVDLLQATDHSMVELLKMDFHDGTRAGDSHNAVVATWLISFQHIQESRYAAEYLSFLACIAPQNVPRSIFPPASSDVEQEEAIGILTGYAFLAERSEVNCYDVHPLIHRVTQNWLKETSGWSKTAREAVQWLSKLIPLGGHEEAKQAHQYLPHGLFTTGIIETCDDQATIDLLDNIGRSRQFLGEYSHAVSTLQEVLNRLTRTVGLKKKATLVAMSELGSALGSKGDYIKGEEVFQEALSLCKEVLGPENPTTLACQTNLAVVLSERGKHEQAEKMEQETLKFKKIVLGKTHPDTLTSMNNLALLLNEQGKYPEAERMCREALEPSIAMLGKTHPDTLTVMNNLALVLSTQGKHSDAEKIYRETLEQKKGMLGNHHPDTLLGMQNLAAVLDKLGKYSEAEKLHLETLRLRGLVLEKTHPDTIFSMDHLAWNWWRQHRYEESISLMSSCTQLSAQVLGSEHPHTKRRVQDLESWQSLQYGTPDVSSSEDESHTARNDGRIYLEIEEELTAPRSTNFSKKSEFDRTGENTQSFVMRAKPSNNILKNKLKSLFSKRERR